MFVNVLFVNLILNAVLSLFRQLFNNNFIDKSVDILMIPSHLGDDRRLRHVIVLHLAHSNKIQNMEAPPPFCAGTKINPALVVSMRGVLLGNTPAL